MMKKFIFALGIIGIVIFVIFSLKFTKKDEKASPSTSGKSKSSTRPFSTVPVTAIVAQKRDFTQFIKTTGTIQAVRKLELISEVSGYVKSLPIHDGATVKKGQLLLQIDEEPLFLELQQHRSAFFKALGECVQEMAVRKMPHTELLKSYFENAFHQNILPTLPGMGQMVFQKRQFTFNQNSNSKAAREIQAGTHSANFRVSIHQPDSLTLTRAEYLILARYEVPGTFVRVKQAEHALNQCRLRAPFEGVVSNLKVTEGAYVTQGAKILTLTNLSRVQVIINVLEEDVPFIHSGSTFILIDTEGNQLFKGQITGVSAEIDQNNRTGKAFAIITNANHRFRDGQYVRVLLEKQTFPDRLVVPREAILVRNDRELVFVVQHGKAQWRYIDLGVQNDRYVEIKSGVAPGDTVVVGGHYSLAHEANVKVALIADS